MSHFALFGLLDFCLLPPLTCPVFSPELCRVSMTVKLLQALWWSQLDLPWLRRGLGTPNEVDQRLGHLGCQSV